MKQEDSWPTDLNNRVESVSERVIPGEFFLKWFTIRLHSGLSHLCLSHNRVQNQQDHCSFHDLEQHKNDCSCQVDPDECGSSVFFFLPASDCFPVNPVPVTRGGANLDHRNSLRILLIRGP